MRNSGEVWGRTIKDDEGAMMGDIWFVVSSQGKMLEMFGELRLP